MSTKKIQTGDNVKITTGKYKGIVGTVTGFYSKTRRSGEVLNRVIVSGVPMATAYQKSYKAAGMAGQMYTVERSVNVSNVALVDEAGKISKVKIDKTNAGASRMFKTTGKAVVKIKATKKEAIKEDPKTAKKTKAKATK